MYFKHRIKFSKWMLLGLATPIPALVAIACGNLDPTVQQAIPPIDTASISNVNQSAAAYLASIARLAPDAKSVSTNISWPSVPPLPPALEEYFEPVQFSPSKEDGTPEPWATTLPTTLPARFNARALSARLAPKPLLLSVLKPVTQAFPAAVLSQIRVDVVQLSSYRAPDFAALKLVGTASTLHFEGTELSAEVTPFIKWQFAVQSDTFQDEAPFVTYLRANTEAISQGDIAAMRARLVSTDPADARIIYATQSGLVDTEPVKTLFPPTPPDRAAITRAANDYLDALVLVRPLPASTHAQMVWPTLPTFPSLLANYYDAPQFASSSASDVAAQWAATLPATISSDFTARPLATRLVAKTNTLGLTSLTRDYPSSALASIKTVVTQIPTYQAPDLTAVKLVGASLAELSWEGLSLSAEVAKFISWKFTLKSATALSPSAFITYLQANAATITDVDLASTEAELSAIDATETRLVFTPVRGLANTAAVGKFFASAPPDKASLTLAANRYLDEVVATKYDALSTHANIVWNTFAPLPAALAPYYEAVEFSTNAASGAQATWIGYLPATIASDFTTRHLDARLRPKTNSLALEVLTKAFPATALSEIKVEVAKLPAYTAPDFAKLKVQGVLAKPFLENFDLNAEIASYVSWKFTVGNSPRIGAAELVEYLQANATSADFATIDSIRAELSLKNPSDPRAVFPPITGAPNVSELAGFARPVTASSIDDLVKRIENLKVKPGAIHSAATWAELPVPSVELSAYYQVPEYFYGEAPYYGFEEQYFIRTHDSWPAKRSFQPPTQLNATLLEQTLYVLILVKPGAPSYMVSRAVDITLTSGIRDVRIDLTALPSFAKLAKEGVSASVALNDPANLQVSLGANFNTNAAFSDLKANADLEFQLDTSPWLSAATMEWQIKRDYLAIDAAMLRSLRWRLQPKNLSAHAASDNTPRTVTITSAMYAPNHSFTISEAVQAEINRLKAALNINIRFVSESSYFHNAVYQRLNYTNPGDSAPTRLSLNADPFTSYLRDVGPNGEAPLVTLYWRSEVNGAWHNANDLSSRQNYLLPNAFPFFPTERLMEVRLDYAGNSLGLISETLDLTASSNVRNLKISFDAKTTVETLREALQAFHVKPGSTADNLQWPIPPSTGGDLQTKSTYSFPEYSASPFASEAAALASPSSLWSAIVPPRFTNPDGSWRHLWVRVRIDRTKPASGGNEVPFAIDISDSSGIRAIPAA